MALVDFLNSKTGKPVLIAMQNFGKYVAEIIFSKPAKFVNRESGKLVKPLKFTFYKEI